MKTVKIIILVLLIALGISAGIAKVMLVPEELDFFTSVGLSETLLMVFGVIQILAGLLLILKKFRKLGAFILAFTFCVSTILIFINGQTAFAFFSILPVLLTLIILRDKSEFTGSAIEES